MLLATRAGHRRLFWYVVFLLVVPGSLMAASEGLEGLSREAPDDTQPLPVPPVTELFSEREDLQAFLLSIESPDPGVVPDSRRAELESLRARLQDLRGVVKTDALASLGFELLIDMQAAVKTEIRSLAAMSGRLSSRAAARDGQLDELAARSKTWDSLIAVAVSRDAPQSVIDMATAMRQEIDSAKTALKAERDTSLEVLSTIAGLQQLASSLDAELRDRRVNLETVSQKAADTPLWGKDAWAGPIGFSGTVRAWHRYWLAVAKHLVTYKVTVVLLVLGIWLGAHWLLKFTGTQVHEALQNDATSLRAAAVFSRPNSAALLAALLGVAWLGPPAPSAFTNLIWALMPFPAAALAVTVYAKPIRLSVYTIAVVLAMMSLKPFFDSMPLVSRFGLLLESFLTMAALWSDYRNGNFRRAFPAVRTSVVRWIIRAVLAALLAAVIAEIIGYVGAAMTIRTFVLGALGIGMIFTSITYVLTGLVLALVHIPPISQLPVVRNQRWTIISTSRTLTRYVMAALWLAATLKFAGLLTGLLEKARVLFNAELAFGAIKFQVSAITVGVSILLATWVLGRLVKFTLGGKSMAGVNLAAGVTFAVSKLLRYAIAVVGFLFAVVAMGFDVTKLTILAGALGVGIGFGMQNIVNNFFSGLILLFERPININDVASVDNLTGTVRQLGVRSTVIETFDGAEVIVPNADLISKTVTNWTKSNRRRRAEIDVGVAYGTNTQAVLDILERVARAHSVVMEDPEPFAVFTGFGDSSLNFRLYVWLSDLSEVVRIPGRIRQQILDELNAANIEIPFPQRDVRVTMSAAASLPDPDKAAKE
ncbi:MAG TPA: mechanosensitive ion channel [Woeseiaceae bacterium]|nr:mechanosensitive ion channel [Woeseiaceae bacterium]